MNPVDCQDDSDCVFTVHTFGDGSSKRSLDSSYTGYVPMKNLAHKRRRDDSPKHSDGFSMIERQQLFLFIIFTAFMLLQSQAFRSYYIEWGRVPNSTRFSLDNPNKAWCPDAKCYNSPLCEPCKRKFLIVIATGRSGSTTLINMLNLLPNVRMAGENNGHLFHGMSAINTLKDTYEYKIDSRSEVRGAWRHHPIPRMAMTCPVQNMYETMNPPPEKVMNLRNGFDDSDTILGFKTVRFHGNKFGETHEESTDFLLETFPCAKFIINIRGDVASQLKSWESAFGTQKDGAEIIEYNQRLLDVANRMGEDKARLIDMSEWSQKDDAGLHVLNSLIDWLGFTDCAYPSLLHANKDGYALDNQQMSLGKQCRF